MSEIIETFCPGWVCKKEELKKSRSLPEIIGFYVWETPCKDTSSRGKTMSQYGWDKNVWKDGDLRSYLLYIAGMKTDETFVKVKSLSEMSGAAARIGLGKTFYKKRDKEKILFYSNGKNVDILTILYYIRCAIAHGRFQIYTEETGSLYAFETVTKKRGSGKYVVRAQMLLSEKTLIEWAKVISLGKASLKKKTSDMQGIIQQEILQLIRKEQIRKKEDLLDALPFEKNMVYKQVKGLAINNVISYDRSKRFWVALKVEE